MIRLVILAQILLAGCGAVGIAAQSREPDDSVPVYRTLYEEGFYREAISVLDSLTAADSVCSPDPLRYLAFCHVARGDHAAGEQVFERLLGCDPHYRCDPVLTSPKLLEVFTTALARYEDLQRPTDSGTSAATRTDSTPGPAIRPPYAPVAPPGNQDTDTAGTRTLPTPDRAGGSVTASSRVSLVQYVPGLLPGGVGQWSQRQWVKGALLLAVQAAAAGGYVWAYRTRQSYYDPNYGWYPPVNEAAYNRYTTYARVGCTVFIGTYTISVIDYFHRQRKLSNLRK